MRLRFNLFRLFAFVSVLAIFFSQLGNTYWDNVWIGKWSLVLIASSIGISAWVGSKIHWSVGLLLISSLISAIQRFCWVGRDLQMTTVQFLAPTVKSPYYPRIEMSHKILEALMVQLTSASAFACALAVTVVMALTRLKDLRVATVALGWCAALNSLMTLYQRYTFDDKMRWGGLAVGNPSMNASLMACLLPFVPGRSLKVLTVLGILSTQTRMGVIVLCAVLLGSLVARYGYSVLVHMGVLAGSAAVGIYGFFPRLLDSTGRTQVWELAINSWWAGGHWLLGEGTGTTLVEMPIRQIRGDVNPTEGFIFAHNDYIQILTEQGIFGALALLAVIVCALRSCRTDVQLSAALFGMMAMACGNYPLRLGVSALAFAIILTYAFKSKKEV